MELVSAMNCPACRATNPDGARFCNACGSGSTVIDGLAATIDDEDLHASFLAVPEVRAVTRGGTLAP